MKVQILADIANRFEAFPQLLDAELVLIAGDITRHGTPNEFYSASNWLQQFTVPTFYIGGNHDHDIESRLPSQGNATLLTPSVVTWNGLKIIGLNRVYDPRFKYKARKMPISTTLEEDANYYRDLPAADIVVSHSPGFGAFDESFYGNNEGSPGLNKYLLRHPPKLCIVGHTEVATMQSWPGICPYPQTFYVNTAARNQIIEVDL